jgi:hypothetical protein
MKIKIKDKPMKVRIDAVPPFTFFEYAHEVYIKLNGEKECLHIALSGNLTKDSFIYGDTHVTPIILDPSQTIKFLLK